jgi:hypothetical protein
MIQQESAALKARESAESIRKLREELAATRKEARFRIEELEKQLTELMVPNSAEEQNNENT